MFFHSAQPKPYVTVQAHPSIAAKRISRAVFAEAPSISVPFVDRLSFSHRLSLFSGVQVPHMPGTICGNKPNVSFGQHMAPRVKRELSVYIEGKAVVLVVTVNQLLFGEDAV